MNSAIHQTQNYSYPAQWKTNRIQQIVLSLVRIYHHPKNFSYHKVLYCIPKAIVKAQRFPRKSFANRILLPTFVAVY